MLNFFSVKFKMISLPVGFKPVFYTAVILLAAVNFALGLPKVTDLAEAKFSAGNIPGTSGKANQPAIAGVEIVPVPPGNIGIPVPVFNASSVLARDLGTDFLLFVKDPDKRVPIASTTKIMTAIVASEYFQQSQILTVPDTSLVGGSNMGLKAGEQITFRSLLYGMLLNSGNDAAYAIAANFPGGVNAFVEAMNRKAAGLGLSNTHFDNPAGFDSPNHFSSAFDLSKIAVLAADNPQLSRAFATKEVTVASVDRGLTHPLKNLNKLLGLPGVMGMKTGTTPAARENLVGLVERDNHKILTVVLGSEDRFGETQKLMDWAYSNFRWQ